VWQYQIASQSGLLGHQVCIGVRDPNPDVKETPTDPSAETVAALRAAGASVVPMSQCSAMAVELILGRVSFASPWEATVEGSAPNGGYRYHVLRSQGTWRVRGADMTWIE